MESLFRYVAAPSECGYLPDQLWSLEYELVGAKKTVACKEEADLYKALDLAHQPFGRVVMFHRADDPAYSPFTVTPNTPVQGTLLPFSSPGFDRSKLPLFLFMWLPDPTMERLTGR